MYNIFIIITNLFFYNIFYSIYEKSCFLKINNMLILFNA
jgi:hypothetical protein